MNFKITPKRAAIFIAALALASIVGTLANSPPLGLVVIISAIWYIKTET